MTGRDLFVVSMAVIKTSISSRVASQATTTVRPLRWARHQPINLSPDLSAGGTGSALDTGAD